MARSLRVGIPTPPSFARVPPCGTLGCSIGFAFVAGSDRYLTSRLQGFGTTIFAEMSALAERTGSINLGQGFPDTDGPGEVADAAIAAIRAGHNQYPPGPGIPELRRAIAEHQRHWYGLDYDPDTEVLVTAGATEAIAAALLALCEPGDEVVTFEPYYDSYAACIAMAGAHGASCSCAPRLLLRPRRARGGGHPAHPACCCSTRRTTRPARSSRAPSSS